MLLLWWNEASETKRIKLEDSIALVKHSLEFIGTHAEGVSAPGDTTALPNVG